MLNYPANELVGALRRTLGQTWEFDLQGQQLVIHHRARSTPFRPRRKPVEPVVLLAQLESAMAEHGITRAPPLPLLWGRETELTISAVQALDPYLKEHKSFSYREGFLPQPVVRLTGDRDETGRLRDGYLTSFVNVSCVLPTMTVDAHAALFDVWLSALSRAGFNARHIAVHGNLQVWIRGQVCGLTLRLQHAQIEIGDLVLLWSAAEPAHMVTDLGSGLERLMWALTRGSWASLIFADLATHWDFSTLDALRTGTLIAASGIAPASRGAGHVLRRLLRTIPHAAATLGLSRAVRSAYSYWTLAGPLPVPWPDVCQCLEGEVLRHP